LNTADGAECAEMMGCENPGEQRWLLGLNMHPRWLEGGGAEDFLLPLRELGLGVLEFTLNLSSSGWAEMDSLIEECRRLGFGLTFHAPYKGPYNPAGFSGAGRGEVERLYRPAIEYAARFADEDGPITLVVHGAKGERPREELRRDTEAFLAWILEDFPRLRPAIELLVKEERVNKIGDGKAELVDIVSALGSPRVGICWDLGHDARNGSVAAPPGFAPLVRHVHVHDISPDGRDHSPLIFGHVPYEERLRQLARSGYEGAVILEVNGHLVSRFAAARGMHPFRILQASLSRLADCL